MSTSEDTSSEEPGPSSGGGPDWSTIEHEIHCPLCDYNLFGLVEPRCPECGFQFEWTVMLDPAAGVHPYLIEHHPDRFIRSYFATAFGAMRPRRFWGSLHPIQRLRPRVLLAYMAIGAALYLGMTLVNSVMYTWAYFTQMAPTWGGQWSPWAATWTIGITADHVQWVVLQWGFVMLWPSATLLSMLVFRISMRRARVRPSHVMRCVAYSLDPATWFTLCIAFLLLPLAALLLAPALIEHAQVWQAALSTFAFLFGQYRLWAAYRLYLRFDHPFLTVLASQIIVLLVGANVYYFKEAWL